MNEKRIVEINGVKVEVDLSAVRVIDEYKVGDNVKILRKTYGGHEVLAGVITEFVNFKELPTVVVACYKNDGYLSGTKIEFIYYNAQTEGIEIAPCLEHELQINKESVIDKFKNQIESKRKEADELEAQLRWFVKYFNKYFSEVEK